MSAFYCLCPEEWYDVHSHFIDENSPGGSDGEEYACDVGDPGSIPGLGRSLEEGNGYPLQYSWGFPGGCLLSTALKNICSRYLQL